MQGESLPGYLIRHFGSNGHKLPYSLVRVLRAACAMPDPTQALEELTAEVGARSPLADLWDAQYSANQPGNLKAITWKDPTPTRLKVCPTCLHADGFHYRLFSNPMCLACPLHRSLLITECRHCSKPFHWSELEPDWMCACGAPMWSKPGDLASAWLVKLAGQLACARDMPVPESLEAISSDASKAQPYCVGELYTALSILRHSLSRTGQHIPTRRELSFLGVDEQQLYDAFAVTSKVAHSSTRRTSLVVVGNPGIVIHCVNAFMKSGPLLSNIFVDALESAVDKYFEEYRALPVSACVSVYFHPHISKVERERFRPLLKKWWINFSQERKVAQQNACEVERYFHSLAPGHCPIEVQLRINHEFAEIAGSRSLVCPRFF